MGSIKGGNLDALLPSSLVRYGHACFSIKKVLRNVCERFGADFLFFQGGSVLVVVVVALSEVR